MYCWYDGKSARYGGLMQFFRVNTSHVCANGRHKPTFWKISTTIVLDKGENCYDQGWDDIGGGLETFRFTLRNWQIILKPFDRSFLFQIWYSPVKRRFWRPLSLKIYKSYNSLFFFSFFNRSFVFTSPELFHLWECFDPGTKTSSLRKQMFPLPHRFQRRGSRRNSSFRKVQTKQIPNHGANLEWHDVRLVFLFFLHDSKICRTCVGSRSSKSYTFDSSETNLTPYNGVIFWGVILTPKRSLKNFFSGVKVTPDIEELK